jgi:TolB-like protein
MELTSEEIEKQLDRLLSSRELRRAGRSRSFLRYIVERTAAGEGEHLKEYVIGIDVFKRDPGFDPRTDAIVRVEASRLRSKLKSYYENEGRNDSVIIRIPIGGYRPEFALRENVEAFPTGQGASARGVERAPLNHGLFVRSRISVAGAALLLLVSLFALSIKDRLWPNGAEQNEAVLSPKIVVLPFDASSNAHDIETVADLLTEKVTFELVRIGDLRVVPSMSAFRYRDEDLSIQELRRNWQVDVILRARVVESSGPIVIEALLVDTASHEKIWVDDSFEGDDLDEVARRIADSANTEVLSVLMIDEPISLDSLGQCTDCAAVLP